MTRIGVLALQGDFQSHAEKHSSLGAKTLLVRKASEVAAIDAIVLPGGESTTLLTLLDEDLKAALQDAIGSGMPTLATCAGVILIAKEVTNPAQSSLKLLDVRAERNAYGRQVDSFIDPNLSWTGRGEKILKDLQIAPESMATEGVFIRAPKMSPLGTDVEVLIEQRGDAVLAKQGNILAATFHPELSRQSDPIYKLFFRSIVADSGSIAA